MKLVHEINHRGNWARIGYRKNSSQIKPVYLQRKPGKALINPIVS